ncbi:unnamed protein product [Coffea canephora]|uniref:DH200=94 genomic scaffold, scaffold_554 n=1 Tax=Coffea canephora TaxID=49390 RepID=A0A068VIR3_COFCA|nr:unnamed protein product [Coffea canephora]
MKIVGEARNPPPSSKPVEGFGWGTEEGDIVVGEKEEEEDKYEKQVREIYESGEFHIN